MRLFVEKIADGGGFALGLGLFWATEPRASIVFWRWEIGIKAARP